MVFLSAIKLSDLKTWEQCFEAREKIELEPMNVVGGLKAWMSGNTTDLTPAAKRKIASIESKMAKLSSKDEE